MKKPKKSYEAAFTKYQGNGNDFIVFDIAKLPNICKPKIITNKAALLCDRNLGIGADGVIILFLTDDQWHMRVINSDGTIAANCGNGLRCAARYLFTHYETKDEITIWLNGQPYHCARRRNAIAVEMGQCTVTMQDEVYFPSLQRNIPFGLVSLGNDHAVFIIEDNICSRSTLVSDVESFLANAKEYNLGFVSFGDDEKIISSVYERGAGWTKSCATGACAAIAFLCAVEQALFRIASVHQQGGLMEISASLKEERKNEYTFDIVQAGDAVHVFKGICDL